MFTMIEQFIHWLVVSPATTERPVDHAEEEAA